jgi:hypothetical protein
MPEFREYYRIPDCLGVRATAKAVLVRIPDVGDVWIPQSQIDDRSEVWSDGDYGDLVISEFIAQEKELA